MMHTMGRWYAGLVMVLAAWAVTVAARFWIRVEPGESVWFMWVLAQGFCAAGVGFVLRGPRC